MWVEDNMKIKVKESVRNCRANEILGYVYSNVPMEEPRDIKFLPLCL